MRNWLVRGLTTACALVFIHWRATAATTQWTGGTADFNTAGNWSAGLPTDDANFASAAPLTIALSANTAINSLTFNNGAAAYDLTLPVGVGLTLAGAGIRNHSSNPPTLIVNGTINFSNTATAADALITAAGGINFFNASSASHSVVNVASGGSLNLTNTSSLAQATVMNDGGGVNFFLTSNAGSATITNSNGGTCNFAGQSGVNNAQILNDNGGTNITQNATLDSATITNINGGAVFFGNAVNAGYARITNGNGLTQFDGSSNAGHATLLNQSGGEILFGTNASAGQAVITNANGGGINFLNNSTAANATIVNEVDGYTEFDDNSTAGNATLINNGGALVFAGNNTGGTARIFNNGGDVDLTGLTAGSIAFGSVAGSGSIEIGAVAVTVGSNDASTEISGGIAGTTGSLTKVGTGVLTLSGASSYGGATDVNAGTLNLTGALSGGVVVGAGGTLTGTGRLAQLTNNGIVAPGSAGVGSLRASSYSGTGVLQSRLDGTAISTLRVTGNATLTGSRLDLTVNEFVIGHYSIVSAGSITGTFDSFTASTPPPLLRLSMEYTSTDALVVIGPAASFASVAATPNQYGVAAALDGAGATASADTTQIITAVSQLSVSDAQRAFSQMSGDALPTFQRTALRSAAAFNNPLHNDSYNGDWKSLARGNVPVQIAYNGDVRDLGDATAPINFSRGLWTRGLGTFDHIKADYHYGAPAADATTGGFQIGYGISPVDDFVLGFSGGYAQTHLSVDDRSSSGDSTAIESGAYARYNRQALFMNGAFNYIGLSNSASRHIQFGSIDESAHTDFDGRLYSFYAQGGCRYTTGANLLLEPSLTLQHSHLQQDGFTETGAPGLNLSVADQTASSVESRLGVRAIREFNAASSSHPGSLAADLAWGHEFANTEDQLTAQLAEASGSSPFTLHGTPRDRNAAILGVDGRIRIARGIQVFAAYEATLSHSETLHGLFGGGRFQW